MPEWNEFQKRVIAVFPQEPVPPLDALFRPGCWTDSSDAGEARGCFLGRRWIDLDPDTSVDCAYSLPLLSNESFTYYVAAYLYYFSVLDEHSDAWEFHLSPPPFGGYSEEELDARASILTDEQRAIVADYFMCRELQITEKMQHLEEEFYAELTGSPVRVSYPGGIPKHGSWVTTHWQQYSTHEARS